MSGPPPPLSPAQFAAKPSHSTPARHGTASVQTTCHDNPALRNQDKMKALVQAEIGDQVWQFEAERIAKMLSRKRRKPHLAPFKEGDIDKLSNYDFDIDDQDYRSYSRPALRKFIDLRRDAKHWPAHGSGESAFYDPLTALLNDLISSWQTTLPDMDKRVYGLLRFVNTHNKYVKDCIKGSTKSLKPDLVGIIHKDPKPPTWWNAHGKEGAQVKIPVEVKSDPQDLLNQSGTYARCLFSASTFRQFALVIAFDFKKLALTFLIFHRGGQTRSEPLLVTQATDLIKMQRIFLSLMTWKSQEDAGIPLFFNGTDIFLPLREDDETGSSFRVVDTISSRICIRGRANHVYCVSPDNTCSPHEDPLFCTTNVVTPAPQAEPLVKKRKHDETWVPGGEGGDEGGDDRPRKLPTVEQLIRKKFGDGNKTIRNEATCSKPKETNPVQAAVGIDKPEEEPEPLVDISPFQQQPIEYVKPTIYRGENELDLAKTDTFIVKFSCNEDKRGSSRCVEADLLEACAGIFGTAQHHASFPICTRAGIVMSNHLFVPSPDESEEDIKSAHQGERHGGTVPIIERRTPWLHINNYAGKSLAMAQTPKELFIAIFHALLGWLGLLMRLYFHRDISFGNLLLTRTAITLQKFDPHFQVQDWEADYQPQELKNEPKSESVKRQVKKLEEILDKLGISDECYGSTSEGRDPITTDCGDCNRTTMDFDQIATAGGD